MNEDAFAIIIFGVLALGVYLIPSIIAFGNGKKNAPAILLLNLALGWTLLGYVVAFVWALTKDIENRPIIVQNGLMQPTAPPQPPPLQITLEQQLIELQGLVDKNLITQEEYDSKRSKLIS